VGCEEVAVHALHRSQRLSDPPAAGRRQPHPTRAGIAGIGLTRDEPARLERAQDLARHHHVGLGVVGEPALGRDVALAFEPPGAREQHELHVGELMRLER